MTFGYGDIGNEGPKMNGDANTTTITQERKNALLSKQEEPGSSLNGADSLTDLRKRLTGLTRDTSFTSSSTTINDKFQSALLASRKSSLVEDSEAHDSQEMPVNLATSLRPVLQQGILRLMIYQEICGQMLNSGYYQLIDKSDKLLMRLQRLVQKDPGLYYPTSVLTSIQVHVLNQVDVMRAALDVGYGS
ncbi:unnamed protein product, partial [Mesorhabditis spiculigera]